MRPDTEFNWTAERVDDLRRMWTAGQSCSEIGRHFGITRSAIAGKVRRLDLERRAPSPSPLSGRVRVVRMGNPKNCNPLGYGSHKNRPKAVPKPVKLIPEPPKPPAALMLPLTALASTSCRWPIGDPGAEGFGFCGCYRFGMSKYCEYHHRLAYVPLTARNLRNVEFNAGRAGKAGKAGDKVLDQEAA
jgi:GcrA cell cycle regulator